MANGYYIFGALALFHISKILYFSYQKSQVVKAEIEISDKLWETYLEKREILLAAKAEELDIDLTGDDEVAFGAGYETHYGTEVRLFIIFCNAKIRTLNSGSARDNIFNYDQPKVKAATDSLMAMTRYHFARMARKNITVPEPGYSRFYILTNKSIYSAVSSIDDVVSGDSDWSELFYEVDTVLDTVTTVEKGRKHSTP